MVAPPRPTTRLSEVARLVVYQGSSCLTGLGTTVASKAQELLPRAAADITQSHEVTARTFVSKFFKGKPDQPHILDTARGPIEFARELQSQARTALFKGQTIADVAAFMAQKAAPYDHDWVAVLAEGGIKGSTILEFLCPFSTITPKNPPLSRAWDLFLKGQHFLHG